MAVTDDSGFLSRWARRKAQARQGAPEPADAVAAGAEMAPAVEPAAPLPPPPQAAAVESAAPPAAPAPTMEDVAQLTPESDYTRFVAGDVGPDVRNAALKKLFTDPRFNVMDGLDTYIDDYGKPDPLPPGMLQKMAQSQFLGLFTEDLPAAAPPAAPLAPPQENAPDEDPDLRLQPDDAAGREGAEPGAGEDPAGQP